MSEGPSPTSWKDAKPYITWGSLVFTCFFVFIEKLVEQSYGQALASFLLGLAIATVALNSKTWLERTDPNWGFAGALILVATFLTAPFVEQHRWPFSTIIRDPPNAEDIAKATAPIQKQLTDVTDQRDAALTDAKNAKSQLEAQERELVAAQQALEVERKKIVQPPPPTQALPPKAAFTDTYSISQSDIRNLRDEIFKIREALPSSILIQTADDGAARAIATSLSKAIGFAGIEVGGMSIGYPITPQETGISIRVDDLGKIPGGAKKLAEAIKTILGVEPRYTAARAIGADNFSLFAGTNPKDN
jgi:hypothetical protein